MRLNVLNVRPLVIEILGGRAVVGHENDQRILVQTIFLEIGQQPPDVIVDDEVHDTREVQIGFRSVRMQDWALVVNGERLFTKGTSVLPTRPLLGDASAPEVVKASNCTPSITMVSNPSMEVTLARLPSLITSQSFRYSLTTPSGDQLNA